MIQGAALSCTPLALSTHPTTWHPNLPAPSPTCAGHGCRQVSTTASPYPLGLPPPPPSTHAESPALSRAQAKGISTSTPLPSTHLGSPSTQASTPPRSFVHHPLGHPPPPSTWAASPVLLARPLSAPSTHGVAPHLPRVPSPLHTSRGIQCRAPPPASMCERGGGRVHKAGVVCEGAA